VNVKEQGEKMLTFKADTDNKKIQIVCNRLNNLYQDHNFWGDVANHINHFHMANIDGKTLRKFFVDSTVVLKVGTYRSRFPSRSNGYTTPSTPNNTWLNTRHLDRSEASVGATLSHESVHCVDNTQPYFTFGHGDNYNNPSKDDCAPNWLADLTYKHLSGGIESNKLMAFEDKFITSQGLPFYERILA
jgi:hypothetical protein